ncbi:chemotaxis protein CheD [Neptuniibacter sp. CAU 1671]|uniref:chemotaxis protein CheD n=1 Tax=Neptuniibacter sp. CAU 1671 TaxID=3032593 RepID=UPI0023DB6271|nr:chemotaxis protein CheD [Neptuniibacter sp. CAU 1671]MDF2182579.1 chemotaxis protein CheD [Neptuniibacter sp. CAU 1671]
MSAPAFRPRIVPGFEQFHLFMDPKWGKYAAKIGPGDYYVACDDMIITTVLGSCISACIHDPVMGMGGVNHFMLPPTDANQESSRSLRYGLFAMEQLINGLMRFGCQKSNMQVKISGGGKILAGMTDIGKQNIDFVMRYINDEGLNLLASDVGGTSARKVVYFPTQGRMLVNKLDHKEDKRLALVERAFRVQVEHDVDDNDVELF